MVKNYGYNCMVTMQSWMFLSSFEKLRKKLIESTTISNLLHMDNMVMKIAFGTSATVFRKVKMMNYNSTFYHVKLSDVENDIVDPLFFNDGNKHIIVQSNFDKIPGNPIAYWVDNKWINCFNNKNLDSIGSVKQGLATSDNNRFLRLWHEVNVNNINFYSKSNEDSKKCGKKWFPYNKGGNYCKWYGNQEYIINWENNGQEIKNFEKSVIRNSNFYFKKSISWSLLSSSHFGVRFYPEGFIFDVNGSSLFLKDNYYYVGGFLTSKLATVFLSILNSTMAFQVGNIKNLPIIVDNIRINEVDNIVKNNIELSKENWDSYETSWNFVKHPLINQNSHLLKNCFLKWSEFNHHIFDKIKNNEIHLNQIFSEIYNVDIDVNIKDNDVTINLADYEKDIKSFISYAVGCIFGRYSLDNEGLQFAGGEFDLNNYHKFVPDDDNIIPVLDSEYFEDDIVSCFIEFVKTCFGEETLEENLDFIADALAKNKKSSRERIRDYLLKNFFNDHKKTYKKCPIYWQFSSGKENGFNCLIYMHRYEPSLVARIRTDYLHKTQKAIEQAITNCDNIINHSSSNSEITKATKDKNKLQKQLKETQEYDEALAHIANQNIEIDLDDGVKVNYAKFQNVEVSKEGKKSKKINLLKKL